MSRLASYAERLRDTWLDHLWIDLAVAGAIVVAHIGLVLIFPATDIFGSALPADRRAVYTSTAVVVSLLGSFSAVAIGQLGSAKGARADSLRAQGAEILARNWRSVFRAGMLSALISLVALLLDPSVANDSPVPVVIRWIFEVGLVFAVIKFLRLSSLFHRILVIAGLSAGEPEGKPDLAEAPVPVANWSRRQAS